MRFKNNSNTSMHLADLRLEVATTLRALAAGVLIMAPALHQQTAAQEFSADAAVATDNSGEAGFVPNALNLAAEEVSGAGAVLERQDLIPVTTLPRTCDCVPADDVVRLL